MEKFPQQNLLSRLVASRTELGRQLAEAAEIPLRDYLKSLIPESPESPNRHLVRFAEALAQWLTDNGQENPEKSAAHVLRVPVIQLADHANLLLDEETFLNNLLFAAASLENGVDLMLSSQCTTVACLSQRNPLKGSGFLRTRNSLYKIFPLSKRLLTKSNFCTLPRGLSMTFEVLEQTGEEQKDSNIEIFRNRKYCSATKGFLICNDEIWKRLDSRATVERVAVDESFTSELVARHLLDSDSPIHKLVFIAPVRDEFLSIKRELIASKSNFSVNRATPDFFWFTKNHHLTSLVFAGKGNKMKIIMENSGAELPILYTPSAIASALRQGRLYADRVLGYIVRCLLPGVVAVGGTSQQDYVKMYRDILLECHRNEPFLEEDEISTVSSGGLSRLGGAPLLELSDTEREMIARLDSETDLHSFMSLFLHKKVGTTIGSLKCADYFNKILDRLEV